MEENLRVVKGIVVREAKTKESRRVLTILTEEGGRVLATAKSADRKNSLQSQAACQLMSYSEFTLFSYRDRVSINEAVCLDMFPEIQADVLKLSLSTYVCDIAARLCEADFPDNEAFRLTMNTIHAIARLGIPQEVIKASFEVRIAAIAGYAPDLERCVSCGKGELTGAFLDVCSGEVFCAQCGGFPKAGITLYYLPNGALSAFRHLLSCDLKDIFRYRITKRDLFALSEAAERYIGAQVGSSRLIRFYHNMARNGEYI